MDAIIADKLTLAYDGKFAARDLSLNVSEGSIFGVLGPEGAGKTTLIKILNGIAAPESGSANVLGYSTVSDREKLHGISGVVTDSAKLYEGLTPTENLNFFGKINGMSDVHIMDRTSYLLHSFDIWRFRDMPVYKLTTDDKRRLSIARAFIADPKVVFLDEPTRNFDIQSVEYTNSAVKDIATDEGITVFVTSDEAEDLNFCDTFMIMDGGENVAQGDISALQAKVMLKNRAVIKVVSGDLSIPGLDMKKIADLTFEKTIDKDEDMADIIKKAVFWGKDIIEAAIIKPTLTDIYQQLVGSKE